MTHATTWFGFWTPTDLEQTVSGRNGLSMYLGPCLLLAKMPPNGRAVCSIFEPTIQLTSGFLQEMRRSDGWEYQIPIVSLEGDERSPPAPSTYARTTTTHRRPVRTRSTSPDKSRRQRPRLNDDGAAPCCNCTRTSCDCFHRCRNKIALNPN